MTDTYIVGHVVSIEGTKINVLMNSKSNLETFHYNGVIYDGVTIGSYVGIIRGSNKIIGRIEKEFLEDKYNDPKTHEYLKDRFERHLELTLIGTIRDSSFEFGVKIFPMIFNEVVLLEVAEVNSILQSNYSSSEHSIPIGKSITNNLPLKLSWGSLFNTHIGIFGNTGSGKSNTLTKLYTELFKQLGDTIVDKFNEKSNFYILDFNGEYLGEQVLYNDKNKINLSTRSSNPDNINKLQLKPEVFWDIETLSILYSATEKTQQPFLKRAVNYFWDSDINDVTVDKIINGLVSAFYRLFKKNNNKDTLNIFKDSLKIIGFDTNNLEKNEDLFKYLNANWHSMNNTFYYEDMYINGLDQADSIFKTTHNLSKKLNTLKIKNNIKNLTITQKLKIIVNSQLIIDLAFGNVNYDFISPLVQRITSRSKFIEKTIEVTSEGNNLTKNLLNVISFRNCNAEAKKMLPLLIVKQLYDNHKNTVSADKKINLTKHFIIDEAHNILSSQSTREQEAWKDYRLEVFEEIIKEGRKFGFYITLSSQRPFDISPTIMSQLHNYFIHRLVNEQDLKMISTTINSLDSVSRSRIPTLAPGQCVLTGTSFEMPLMIQVDKLDKEYSPLSESANLEELWLPQNNQWTFS
ncbi:ATP-binding protein [Dolosigranulum pigrum]|uniref:ATP-binding protein n=1 Tax=Dolosigranulum pigrum TaxID=29394 RepID=UPI001AD87CF7|nr:ATP-binding protein [Dolosigranulum pigrum]QTJ38009.1 ATP-binding protein [Dolosigranulum pigrum]